ncbi:hypothetical protein [Streptomyces xiamenensis]|uniref:hypothetical protein n=1 Tax=Streptomyces xiamenensis TaxID=408015 RepID=UPI0037D58172
MSLTPERLEEIRAMRFAISPDAAAELLAEVDQLRAELAEEARATQYYAEQSQRRRAERDRYHQAWHNAADRAQDARDDVKFTEERLRAELAARPTRTAVLEEAADTLVAACPDHGERSDCRMTCACDVAAELRMDAAGHPVHEAPVLPWLPLLDDEDRDSLAVALEEEVCGGTDNVMCGLEHLLSRYRRFARPASAPAADGGAR